MHTEGCLKTNAFSLKNHKDFGRALYLQRHRSEVY